MLIFTSFPPLSFVTFLYLFLPLPSLYPLYLCLPIFTSFLSLSVFTSFYISVFLFASVCLCWPLSDLYLFLPFSTSFYLTLPLLTLSTSFLPLSLSPSTCFTCAYHSVPLLSLPLFTSFYPSVPLFTPLPVLALYRPLCLYLFLSLSLYIFLPLSAPIFTCVYHSVPLLFCLSSLLSVPLYPCLSTSLYLFTSTFLYLFLPLSTHLVTSTLSTCIYFSSPLFAASFVLFLSFLLFSGSLHLHFSCVFPFHFATPLPLSVCPIFFPPFSRPSTTQDLSKSLHTNSLPFVATTSRLPKTRRKIETANGN